jgi:hypothetical protein
VEVEVTRQGAMVEGKYRVRARKIRQSESSSPSYTPQQRHPVR